MPPDNSDAGFLWDMIEYARGVVATVAGMTFEQYLADANVRLAVERRIEIIGEAAGRVSQEFRNAHAEIPWRKIVAQRHVLAHRYGEIDDELIWMVATVHLPALIETLEKLIPQPPSC